MIYFKDITENNFDAIIDMRLPVGSHVAANVYSLAQAWLYKEDAKPYAIYHDEVLIGFIMFDVDYEERELGIWRFMIASNYQNKGYGYQVLMKILDEVDRKAFDYIYLSTSPENRNAIHLYKKVGFCETGEVDEGEIIFRYDF